MKLEPINQNETIRYLGYGNHTPDENIMSIMSECEKTLTDKINPAFVYKIFDKEYTPEGNIRPAGTNIIFYGNDIREHLKESEKILMMCATLTSETDKIIRLAGITDKAKSLVLDAMSCAAIEQVCDRVCDMIHEEYPQYFQTKRFSPGYGDFPLDTQESFLRILDASKRIGVTLNDNNLMIPMKTVTAVAGLSLHELPEKKTGCCCCSRNKTCEFRKAGNTCGY